MEDVHMDSFHEEPQSSTPPQSNGAAPAAPTGGRRVYVGNLSWDTRWQGLKDHMREAGDVVHAEVFTESSGRSAGCGIVEFETPEGAQNAINSLNDTMLDSRTIFVRADREEGKPRRLEGDHGYRRRESDRGRKIVVWNLPYHIRWQDLKDLFRDYGNVIRADIPQTHDGKSKGMGTVLFETEMEAERAIREMTGKEVDGRVVDCRLDKFA
ncbi:putative RNA-binding protein [Gracilariopsis chorda]|uniref:Putative RNA-binding protein n=1 Tax=Gracilariopsis chorda TaxID=448386 RepID=A0A2V3J250_9FLOR|nr:putative RNA-binding protein [Gracilariopsis chorda]|eukprot:PXF48531.1 putative RNA-binding protein [Gracilariopsis chorda]